MKKIFLMLISFVVIAAHAQTADEVVQKYATYLGGLDAFNKVTSAKMTGVLFVQGMELPITIQIINGKSMRTDVEAMGQSVINVYNNGTGWKINPFNGAPDATDVTGAELNEFKSQANLANALMDYKKMGNQVELLGEEDVNGIKTIKLKLTAKEDGKTSTYFLNSSDYSMVKSISTRDIMGQETEIETYYTEYKDFNGLKFCTARRQEVQGQELQAVAFSNVELNVPIDEKIFAK